MSREIWVKTPFGKRRHVACNEDWTWCGIKGFENLTANGPTVYALEVCVTCQRLTGLGN